MAALACAGARCSGAFGRGRQRRNRRFPSTHDTAPFIVDQNIDTLYVNLLAPALPRRLATYARHLKAQAQEAGPASRDALASV